MKNKLTISEAARILNVHPNTLRNWDRKKILTPIRDKRSNYRYYTNVQIQNFLMRGARPKIEMFWGKEYSIQARRDELEKTMDTLDVLVSSEATTTLASVDDELFSLLRRNLRRNLKVRFVRNFVSPEMKLRAEKMRKLGIKTKNRMVCGVTMSIRDKKVVRLEVPGDNPGDDFNLFIYDSKAAKSFSLLFENIWQKT